MKVFVNQENKLKVEVNEKDACYSCANTGVCMFIHALEKEFVIPRYAEIEVTGCDAFLEPVQEEPEELIEDTINTHNLVLGAIKSRIGDILVALIYLVCALVLVWALGFFK